MKKKIAALALIVVLLSVAVVGGTMAYFTDTDSATNVFTVGNVEIELVEKMAQTKNWYSMDFVDWSEQELIPGEGYYNKVVLVKNTGENDAYVRVKIRYQEILKDVLDVGMINSYSAALAYGGQTTETINGTRYIVETLYTTAPVKAGYYFSVRDAVSADTEPSSSRMLDCAFVESVLLDSSFDWYMPDVFEGAFSYTQDNGETMIVLTENGKPDFSVEVIAEAIQADGFANYTDAFAAFDAQNS